MKKRSKIIGLVAAVVAVVAIIGATVVSAQSPADTPPAKRVFGERGEFRGRGGIKGPGFERGPSGQGGLEAIAEALGMTADELSAELRGGKTLADLAEEAGVDLATLQDEAKAAREAAVREAIEQAVEDGTLTREQADWTLQGIDSGYTVRGGFLGRSGFRGFAMGKSTTGQTGLDAAAEALGMTADELSLQLWGGRTLADLAEAAGVDLQEVQDAVEAARQAAMRDAIEQAVEDGNLTREQADWILQGIDSGYALRDGFMGGFGGRSGGRGRGGFGRSLNDTDAGFRTLGLPVDQSA